ncbi:hypothetical protein ACTXT7_009451 [Hymenolepis weldensis]
MENLIYPQSRQSKTLDFQTSAPTPFETLMFPLILTTKQGFILLIKAYWKIAETKRIAVELIKWNCEELEDGGFFGGEEDRHNADDHKKSLTLITLNSKRRMINISNLSMGKWKRLARNSMRWWRHYKDVPSFGKMLGEVDPEDIDSCIVKIRANTATTTITTTSTPEEQYSLNRCFVQIHNGMNEERGFYNKKNEEKGFGEEEEQEELSVESFVEERDEHNADDSKKFLKLTIPLP